MATTTRRQDFTSTGALLRRAGGRGLVALAVLASAACDSEELPTAPVDLPGALAVTTVTTGFMQDTGYELFVNGESRGTIGADDQVTLPDLEPGAYDVTLDDVAENCTVESGSVQVAAEQTAQVTVEVVCEAGDPVNLEIRARRDRPDLDSGTTVECNFGLCPSDAEWDLFVEFNSQSDPQSVIRQNQGAGVEIAHVVGVPLAELSEQDVADAQFSGELEDRGFSAGSTVLIRSTDGNVYALGNPQEDTLLLTLAFDAVLIIPAS